MSIPYRKPFLLAHCARLALSTLLLVGNAEADASNLNFLNDTPISYMKPRDMESIKGALVQVLNTSKDAETTGWTNAQTGNSVRIDATMTPETTVHDGAKTCRSVTINLLAKGQSMTLHPVFCGTGGRDWSLQKR
ncbi:MULTISPECIES: hypothetical protein [Paraburkholderia]|uniref:hypothetical protein n=1 Tax=Paraburkholderia TaxID=1822464 RepID=UPI0007ECF535|nr:hypothetical protein [Paraburkholderia tropica]MBB2979777.1 hypothetical protein [Paraburkholderia tropica]OBR53257.1 hypothetical protein A6456_14680 [Paraburkholderia tropica]